MSTPFSGFVKVIIVTSATSIICCNVGKIILIKLGLSLNMIHFEPGAIKPNERFITRMLYYMHYFYVLVNDCMQIWHWITWSISQVYQQTTRTLMAMCSLDTYIDININISYISCWIALTLDGRLIEASIKICRSNIF